MIFFTTLQWGVQVFTQNKTFL